MSTVKSLIDKFCDRINQPRESSYVGNTSPAARQYLSLFEFIADELLDNPNGWAQLKRIHSFTITQNQSNYQLPGDYLRMLRDTQYGSTNQIPLAGPISDAQMAFQTYGVAPLSPYSTYQLNGAQGYTIATAPYAKKSTGYFQISPTGQNSTDVNVFAYISSNYVWPTDWVSGQAYILGAKVTGINNIYICTDAITTSTTRPSVVTGTEVDGDGVWTVYTEPYPITADTDFFLLDDQLMIEGLRWAWYQSKKQDYANLKQQWESSVKTAVGRQNGAISVNAGYNKNNYLDLVNTPIGNWSGFGDV